MKKVIKIEHLFLAILLIGSFYLRFKNLGYSDYIGDEHKAFIELGKDQKLWEFFMDQRKGPMQFLVSHVPYLITGDFRNELAERIPFAAISVMAVFTFYFLVKKLVKNKIIAFISAFLFMVNGFIVGFGRIAQYQNLNLLFSLLALYFYSDLLERGKGLIRSSFLGTFFWSLSILSHWDAVFILPMAVFIFVKFLSRKELGIFSKWKLVFYNFFLGCLLLLPFLIPYISYQASHAENALYFERRVETGHSLNERYKLLIKLYNPFVTFWFLIIAGSIGALFIGTSYPYLLWSLFAYGVFELFVRKPGTHIYNFLIPIFILSGIGIKNAFKVLPNLLKKVYVFLAVLVMGFLFYQAYFIFVDHTREYPWQEKKFYYIYAFPKEIQKLETPIYTYEQKLPLFGFPHKRYWNEINEYVNEQNATNNEKYGYITNEWKTISEWYMDAKYKADKGFYVVGIKEPLSFVEDWRFMQIGGKELVYSMKNDQGEIIVRVYRVEE